MLYRAGRFTLVAAADLVLPSPRGHPASSGSPAVYLYYGSLLRLPACQILRGTVDALRC